jgi:hypothetical protein
MRKRRCDVETKKKKTGHVGRLKKYLAISEGVPEPESDYSMLGWAIVRNGSKRATLLDVTLEERTMLLRSSRWVAEPLTAALYDECLSGHITSFQA